MSVKLNVTTTCLLLPFVKHLVKYSCAIIKDKKQAEEQFTLKYVDERLLTTPHVALMQVKKEISSMLELVEENIGLSFAAIDDGTVENNEKIQRNEEAIDFTNRALTQFLIKLSTNVEESDEKVIGAYFHVLNDLERIGDNAENFHEIGVEMLDKKIEFSDLAHSGIVEMRESIMSMFTISKDAFEKLDKERLVKLTMLEEKVDDMKKRFIASHFARLAEGNCSADVSPYYSSIISGLERVADHLVNVGFSIDNPIGSQKIGV